jgi:hypothetical protein
VLGNKNWHRDIQKESAIEDRNIEIPWVQSADAPPEQNGQVNRETFTLKVTSWWLRCSACLGIAVELGDQGLRAHRATGECEAELMGDGRGARGGEAQVILAGLLSMACVEELRPDEDGEVFRCAAVASPGIAGSSAVATQGGGARAADEAEIGQRPWTRLVSGAATRGRGGGAGCWRPWRREEATSGSPYSGRFL